MKVQTTKKKEVQMVMSKGEAESVLKALEYAEGHEDVKQEVFDARCLLKSELEGLNKPKKNS